MIVVKRSAVKTELVRAQSPEFCNVVKAVLKSADPTIESQSTTGQFWKILIEKHFPVLICQRHDITDYRQWAEELARQELGLPSPVYVLDLDFICGSKLSEPVFVEPENLNNLPYSPTVEHKQIIINGMRPERGSRGYVAMYTYMVCGHTLATENIAYITGPDGDMDLLFNSMINQLSPIVYQDLNSDIDNEYVMNNLHEDGFPAPRLVVVDGHYSQPRVEISIENFLANPDILTNSVHAMAKIFDRNDPSEVVVSIGRSDTYVHLYFHKVIF